MFIFPPDFSENIDFISNTPWLENNGYLQAIFWVSQVTVRFATQIFVVYIFGKKLLDTIRLGLNRRTNVYKNVYIILGGDENSVTLGEGIASKNRLILFLIDESASEKDLYEKVIDFGGIVRTIDTRHTLEDYLTKAVLRKKWFSVIRRLFKKDEVVPFKKRVIKIFLMPNDLSAADRTVKISEFASKYSIDEKSEAFEIFFITSSDWAKEKVVSYIETKRVKHVCNIIDETDLIIRTQVIHKHPPVECPELGFMDDGYNKSGKAKREFTVLILGFKKVGQRALMQLIMNGQFVCKNDEVNKPNMHAIIVESHAEQNVEGFFKHVPGLVPELKSKPNLCCSIETINCSVPSKELTDVIEDNMDKVDYIVIALDDGELNRFASRYIERYYRNKGKIDKLPFIAVYDKNWIPIKDVDEAEEKDERIFRFGCREKLYTEKIILREEQDKIAKVISRVIHKKKTWRVLDYYTQESYRASADFFRSMMILIGGDKDLWKKIGAFYNNEDPPEAYIQTEHMRWSTFYIVARGYKTMTTEEMNKRFNDSDGKYHDTPNGRSARLKYIRDDEEKKLHANVVSWGSKFKEANATYIKIAKDCGYESSGGFRLFPINYLKGLPLISLATAGDEEIKKHKEGTDKGITNDQKFMAYHYYIEENYTKAFPLLKTLADKDNVIAMFYLSQCFYNGYGTKQNKTEGNKWYSKWKNAEN